MKQHGQALVEFALIVVPLVLLVLGIVHGYFVFRAYTALGDAAEVGAETAAIFGGDCPQVAQAIEASLEGDFVRLPYTYTVVLPESSEPGCARVGDPVLVQIAYTEPLRFLFFDLKPKPQRALRFAERDCRF